MRDWWGEVWHNLVLASGGFRVYYLEVQESLIFQSVTVGYFPQTQTEYESRLQAHLEGDHWMTRQLPGVVGEFVEANALVDFNNKMLGVESFCTPDGLRELLVYEIGIVPRPQYSHKG